MVASLARLGVAACAVWVDYGAGLHFKVVNARALAIGVSPTNDLVI